MTSYMCVVEIDMKQIAYSQRKRDPKRNYLENYVYFMLRTNVCTFPFV